MKQAVAVSGFGWTPYQALFAHEAGTDPQILIDQMVTGGLCWTMSALRWVVETGVHEVPVSREWIDELVTETLRGLAERHQSG